MLDSNNIKLRVANAAKSFDDAAKSFNAAIKRTLKPLPDDELINVVIACGLGCVRVEFIQDSTSGVIIGVLKGKGMDDQQTMLFVCSIFGTMRMTAKDGRKVWNKLIREKGFRPHKMVDLDGGETFSKGVSSSLRLKYSNWH